MRRMAARSSSPPVHVHIREATPVHVHVGSLRTSPSRTPRVRHSSGEVQDHQGGPRSHSQGKDSGTRAGLGEGSFVRVGGTHAPPGDHAPLTEPGPDPSPLRLADLASEEDFLQGHVGAYERKIDSLLTEVRNLKNEVEQQREHLLERQEVSEQRRQLEDTETETDGSPERTHANRLQQALLRKLAEAESDGAAAAQHVSHLRDGVSRLCSAGRDKLPGSAAVLANQEQLLLQKLQTFEATNRTLRTLLREQHQSQVDCVQLSEQKSTLLKRLTDTEAENARLVLKLGEKEREVDQLCRLLDTEKDSARSSADLSKSLEATRARLQGQLRRKESENNRLSVQIKNLERAGSQQKVELEHLMEQMMRLKQRAGASQEALKQAARAQKQRAEHSEDAAAQLSLQLQDMEKQLADGLEAAEAWRSRYAEEEREKRRLETELSLLNSQMAELTEQLRSMEDKGRTEREALLDHLHGLTSESTATKLDNQSLKVTASAGEEKLALCQSELRQVKASIKQYESLLDSYKMQVGRTGAEADEYRARLAQGEQEARAVRTQLEQEVEEVRRELLGRLAELEPLPDALRRTQLQLQEARDREESQERHNAELSSGLTELHLKMETQRNQMDVVRQKNKVLLEENKQLQQQVEGLERKLEEAGSQSRDLLAVVSKLEKMVRSNQSSLEEKTREGSVLSRQLEEALNDAQQQVSESRERAAIKDRLSQSKILDLEGQLSRTNSEIMQLTRSKEEMESRYQSRLQDLKDRLEQSDGTNRSLQNYVQFLKASYADVFGEGAPSGSLWAPSPIS